jgi:capsular polysaccharide biosynthesis protein
LYIQRSESRRILNEQQVQDFILNAYQEQGIQATMETLNLRNTTNLLSVVSALSQADFIYGMHGAAMYAAAVFCKPGAIVVEIFPYGIQAKVVSPVQSLARMSNSVSVFKIEFSNHINICTKTMLWQVQIFLL